MKHSQTLNTSDHKETTYMVKCLYPHKDNRCSNHTTDHKCTKSLRTCLYMEMIIPVNINDITELHGTLLSCIEECKNQTDTPLDKDSLLSMLRRAEEIVSIYTS